MALELSSRYLDDYLTGDRYFNAKYPTQNLDRARNQIALAKDMDKKMAQMMAIVKETAKRLELWKTALRLINPLTDALLKSAPLLFLHPSPPTEERSWRMRECVS